eukprot:gene4743-3399_t
MLDPRSLPPHVAADQRRFDHSANLHYGDPRLRQFPPAGRNDPRYGGHIDRRYDIPDHRQFYDERGYGSTGPTGPPNRPFDEYPQYGRQQFNPAVHDQHLGHIPNMPMNQNRSLPQHILEGRGIEMPGNRASIPDYPSSGPGRPLQRGYPPVNGPANDFPPHASLNTDRPSFPRGDFPPSSLPDGGFSSNLQDDAFGSRNLAPMHQSSLLSDAPRGPPSSSSAATAPRPLLPGPPGQLPVSSEISLVPAVPSVVKEVMPILAELAGVAGDSSFVEIAGRVKDQLLLLSVTPNRGPDGNVDSLIIEAPTREKAALARNLLETHLKQQWKIKMAESRLQKLQTDLNSTQGEIRSGHMVEVVISPELVGLTIGKKGSRIKQIEAESGVTNINVGDNGHILIYGSDSNAVQRAREQLELKEEKCRITQQQLEWIANKANGNVVASLMLSKLNVESCSIELIGTHQAVDTAKLLLTTQLEYIDKQIEIENTERNAREKLHAVRKQYGMNNANWKSRGSQDNFDPKAMGKAAAKAGDSGREMSLPPPPGLVPLSARKSQQPAPPKVDDFLDALISSTKSTMEASRAEASRAEAAREQSKDSKGRGNNKGKKEQQEAAPAPTKAQESTESRKGKSTEKDKKKAESDKRGRTVQVEAQPDSRGGKLPPPPTLTVPAPSEQQNEGGEEEKKKNRRDRKKKSGKKEGGESAEEVAKEGSSDVKEPMLTKINIPFQKSAATAELPDSPVIPIPPRQSGPPKEPSSVVIPPKGPPAKELVPQASSDAPREQTPKKSEDETTSGKSHGSIADSAEANLSGEKKLSGRKNRSKDNDKEETTTADASDNQPTSPAAGNREGSSRRTNVSKVAIMDSLMMVRPDSTSSPAKASSTEKSSSAEKEPTIVRSKSGGDEVKADA